MSWTLCALLWPTDIRGYLFWCTALWPMKCQDILPIKTDVMLKNRKVSFFWQIVQFMWHAISDKFIFITHHWYWSPGGNLVVMSPHPWGEGGHIDLLWFPVTQMCVRVCARLYLRDISYSFSDMVPMDKTLNWLTFHDHASILKVTGVIMFQN